MSRGTVRIVLLLLSAVYVSAIRQPLTVKQLEQVDPTTLVSTVPQAAVETASCCQHSSGPRSHNCR
jgi:hypothetical protein